MQASPSHLPASCTPEVVFEVLMKVALIYIGLVISVWNFFFFFYLGFLSQTFMNHRTAGEGEGHLFEVGLSPSNNFLFTSMIALQK